MKRLVWIISGIMAVASWGCSDLLEVKPRNVILAEDALKTPEDVQKLLISAYDLYRSDDFMGGNVWAASELLADNIDGTALTGNLLAIYNRNTSLFTDISRRIWNTAYTVIYRTNLILEAIPRVPGFTPEQRANMRGQALFLRAACHFELVRFFAQPYGYSPSNDHPGIPLRLNTGRDPVGRASVGEVYTQILSDLNTAVQELPGSIRVGYANVWAAKGMLARVYFQMNNFSLAYKFSKDVVTNGPNIYEYDLRKRFARGGNTDNVFELVSTGNALPGEQSGAGLIRYFSSASGAPQLPYSSAYYIDQKADTADKRLKFWLKVVPATATAPEAYYPVKLNVADWFNIPVIHLGEMKLIRAESAAEQGFLTESIIEVNDIRRRAGLKNFNAFFSGDVITECRKQRRLEMVLEGNRIHDLKRQAVRSNPGLKIRNAPWSCPGMVFAIPDDEMSANPLIFQNPLGGCN